MKRSRARSSPRSASPRCSSSWRAILVPALLGLQRYVITGGSMTGTIPKGAVIYSQVTPVGAAQGRRHHHLHSARHRPTPSPTASSPWRTGPDGEPAFRTKGDFNEVADPWNPVTLNEPQQARYVFQVPLLGYVLAALSLRTVRIAAHRPPGRPDRPLAALVALARGRRGGRAAARGRRPPHDARSRA